MPFLQLVRRARSLAPAKLGKRSDARMAMMAITTNSSIKVKARRAVRAETKRNGTESGIRNMSQSFLPGRAMDACFGDR